MKKSIISAAFIFFLSFLCVYQASAITLIETKTITAENTFTTPYKINGEFILWIEDASSMAMTVTCEYSPDNISWIDGGDTWTSEGLHFINKPLGALIKCGVATGSYTSGTAIIRITTE